MAINKYRAKQFRKYIDESEEILSTAYNQSILGDETERYCLTKTRIGILQKPGLIKWEYKDIPIGQIKGAIIDEGVFKSHIVLTKTDDTEIQLLNIENSDASDFFDKIKKNLYNI